MVVKHRIYKFLGWVIPLLLAFSPMVDGMPSTASVASAASVAPEVATPYPEFRSNVQAWVVPVLFDQTYYFVTNAPATGPAPTGYGLYQDTWSFPDEKTGVWEFQYPSKEGIKWHNFGPAQRRETGVGGTAEAFPGETVIGAFIQLADGQVATNCLAKGLPKKAIVKDGVINPWAPEQNAVACGFTGGTTPTPPTPIVDGQRQPTGVGGILRFERGWRVAGFAIRYDSGRTVRQCYEPSAPEGGSLQDGVLWPWLAEVADMPNCPR